MGPVVYRRPAGVIHVWYPGWFCSNFHPAACLTWW